MRNPFFPQKREREMLSYMKCLRDYFYGIYEVDFSELFVLPASFSSHFQWSSWIICSYWTCFMCWSNNWSHKDDDYLLQKIISVVFDFSLSITFEGYLIFVRVWKGHVQRVLFATEFLVRFRAGSLPQCSTTRLRWKCVGLYVGLPVLPWDFPTTSVNTSVTLLVTVRSQTMIY